MKNYTAVMLTKRNHIVERTIQARTLAIAAGLACTLYRGEVLAVCED